MSEPQVVSSMAWLAARRDLLAEEKEFTRRRDALSAKRGPCDYDFHATFGDPGHQVQRGTLPVGRSRGPVGGGLA